MATDLREALAALEHEQWAHWTEHMLGQMAQMIMIETGDAGLGLHEALIRWRRQIATPYADLSRAEQLEGLWWADKVLSLLEAREALAQPAPTRDPMAALNAGVERSGMVLTNCWSCRWCVDSGVGPTRCIQLEAPRCMDEVEMWADPLVLDDRGMPPRDATGCPGYSPKT